MSEWREENYWEHLAQEEESITEHVEERTDDGWRIHAVMLTDTDDEGNLYLLVIRSRVGDNGNLILSERYFVADPIDPWRDGTGYTSNGIERRVSGGGMMNALKVAYAAVSDGVGDDKTLVMEADDENIQYDTDLLTEPLRDLRAERKDPHQSVENEEQPETVECDDCGQEVPREGAVNIGMDLGIDAWVHEGACPEGGEGGGD